MKPNQIIGTALDDTFQESDGFGGVVSRIYLIGALHYLSLSERERDQMEKAPATVPPMDEVRLFWENADAEEVIPARQDTDRGNP
jgi:hypothetical protein